VPVSVFGAALLPASELDPCGSMARSRRFAFWNFGDFRRAGYEIGGRTLLPRSPYPIFPSRTEKPKTRIKGHVRPTANFVSGIDNDALIEVSRRVAAIPQRLPTKLFVIFIYCYQISKI
jgi:hypothetical protein